MLDVQCFNRKIRNIHTIEGLLKSVSIYRQIDLLVSRYNKIHRKILIPFSILGGVMCSCIPGFVLISRSRQLDFSSAFIFVNLILMGVNYLLVCLHFPATLNKTSLKTLSVFKIRVLSPIQCFEVKPVFMWGNYRTGAGGRKLLRKYWKSMSPLKIRFLHSNYLDRLTPLVFFKLSIRVAIQLTLIKGD